MFMVQGMVVVRCKGLLNLPTFHAPRITPNVTVVVVAHNESRNLRVLVPALLRQQYENFEVLVVLDRCSDDSEDYLTSLKSPLLHILKSEGREGWNPKKAGIALAAETAKGTILLFTDADCTPLSDRWISSMAEAFQPQTDLVIGYSPYTYQPGFLNKVIQFDTLFTAFQYLGLASAGNAYMSVGRNWSYRSTVYQSLGFGKTASITGGDDDLLFQRLLKEKNYQVNIKEESWVESLPHEDWRKWFRQKRRHLSVGRHYSLKKAWLPGVFLWTWWMYLPLLGILFFSNFWLAVVFFILRLLVIAAIFYIIARSLRTKITFVEYILLDIFYNICYFMLSLSVLLSKKVQWK